MAQRYAIASLEARAYLEHPRYFACVEALQDLGSSDPVAIFGETDAKKLCSSLTLFEAARGKPLFAATIDRWFGGVRDKSTLTLLAIAHGADEERQS